MNKLYTSLFTFVLLSSALFATDHTILTQGTSYSPDDLVVQVGDNITIVATASHPTTEVTETAWNANQSVPLPGGFGTHSSSFTFQVTEPGEIFYVCDNHIAAGMKGKITVQTVGVDELSNEISVDFGKLPVEGGVLNYSISANQEDLGVLELINLGGRTIASTVLDSSEGTMDLNASTGVYIVLIKDKNGSVIFRQSISVK